MKYKKDESYLITILQPVQVEVPSKAPRKVRQIIVLPAGRTLVGMYDKTEPNGMIGFWVKNYNYVLLPPERIRTKRFSHMGLLRGSEISDLTHLVRLLEELDSGLYRAVLAVPKLRDKSRRQWRKKLFELQMELQFLRAQVGGRLFGLESLQTLAADDCRATVADRVAERIYKQQHPDQ